MRGQFTRYAWLGMIETLSAGVDSHIFRQGNVVTWLMLTARDKVQLTEDRSFTLYIAALCSSVSHKDSNDNIALLL